MVIYNEIFKYKIFISKKLKYFCYFFGRKMTLKNLSSDEYDPGFMPLSIQNYSISNYSTPFT